MSDNSFHIIPSIRKIRYLANALETNNEYILLSEIHIGNLKEMTEVCHQAGKKVIVNLDLIDGFQADTVGIKLLKQLFKVDAIMGRGSSKMNIAKSVGLTTIQRVILEDTIALESSIKFINESKSDMIELRPGLYGLKFLEDFKKVRDVPFILSGFVDQPELVKEAKKLGFFGVTTSYKELWNVT